MKMSEIFDDKETKEINDLLNKYGSEVNSEDEVADVIKTMLLTIVCVLLTKTIGIFLLAIAAHFIFKISITTIILIYLFKDLIYFLFAYFGGKRNGSKEV